MSNSWSLNVMVLTHHSAHTTLTCNLPVAHMQLTSRSHAQGSSHYFIANTCILYIQYNYIHMSDTHAGPYAELGVGRFFFYKKWTFVVICVDCCHLVHDRCAKHPQHAKHASCRGGLGACPPRKNLKISYQEIEFHGISATKVTRYV